MRLSKRNEHVTVTQLSLTSHFSSPKSAYFKPPATFTPCFLFNFFFGSITSHKNLDRNNEKEILRPLSSAYLQTYIVKHDKSLSCSLSFRSFEQWRCASVCFENLQIQIFSDAFSVSNILSIENSFNLFKIPSRIVFCPRVWELFKGRSEKKVVEKIDKNKSPFSFALSLN